MAYAFQRQGKTWFCSTGLPSDIIIEVQDISFHLHKFPLLFKSGRIANIVSKSTDDKRPINRVQLPDFPGGPEAFELAAKFCYGEKVDFTPSNIGIVLCAAEYLQMTEEYGEGNLIAKAEEYLHKVILGSWNDCICALRSCEPVLTKAEELQIVTRCVNALATMSCTNTNLFGWSMKAQDPLHSPGGSFLWNGISSSERERCSFSGWWYEDISVLCLPMFEKVIKGMEANGMPTKNVAGAIMHFAKKHLPGLRGRYGDHDTSSKDERISLGPFLSATDHVMLLEAIERLLPMEKGTIPSRFLFAMLRMAIILNASHICKDRLERRIGIQLELSTLDSMLIINHSYSEETLYDTDCMERIIQHFLTFNQESFRAISSTPVSPSSNHLMTAATLIDDYLAEVASDLNLKPAKFKSLTEALPENSRSLHDGLYRAVDIYLKAHPWLLESEKEQLCQIISCQKLSLNACTHAAENERLPLRTIIRVLFFQQLNLRTAMERSLRLEGSDNIITNSHASLPTHDTQVEPGLHEEWETGVHENQFLKLDMDNVKSRVAKLEQECAYLKQKIQKIGKWRCSLGFLSRKIVRRLNPQATKLQISAIESENLNQMQPVEQATVEQSNHRRSFSIF